MSDQREQDSNQVAGGKEDLLHQWATTLDLSKNGTSPAAQG
jgi:hypothetical protein